MQTIWTLRERDGQPLPAGVEWVPRLPKGQSLPDFKVGGSKIFLLETGLAFVERSRGGNRWDCLGYRRPSSTFGELADISGRPFIKRVTAMKHCSLFAIDRNLLSGVMNGSSEIAGKLQVAQIQDAQAIEDRAALFDHTNLKERAPGILLDLVEVQAGGKLAIPHNQDVLAKILGTTRPTLNQVLMKYKRGGILVDSPRTIINGEEGLRKLQDRAVE